jgi:hypothetical protein
LISGGREGEFVILSLLLENRVGAFDAMGGNAHDCITLISVVGVGTLVLLSLLPENRVGAIDAMGGNAED